MYLKRSVKKRGKGSTNLKKLLDSIFSKYIRLRDSDENGIGKCITCTRIRNWRAADNGHFIKRQHLATRFNEQNCNLQCKHCNSFEQGANEKYKVAIDKKWRVGTSDKLELIKHNKTRYATFYYKMLIAEYKEKIKKLMKGKNFKL